MKSSIKATDARYRLAMIRMPMISLYLPYINLTLFHFIYHLIYVYIVVFAGFYLLHALRDVFYDLRNIISAGLRWTLMMLQH